MPLLIFNADTRFLESTSSCDSVEHYPGLGLAVSVDSLPEQLDCLRLNESGDVVQDVESYISLSKQQQVEQIKAQAKTLIEELEGVEQWRLRKVEQKAALSSDITEKNRLYAQIDHLRIASDAAESELAEMADLVSIEAFIFEPEAFVWTSAQLSPLGYKGLFNLDEISAIYASTNPQILSLLDTLKTVQYVDVCDPQIMPALTLMTAENILTTARQAEIEEKITALVNKWQISGE